MCTYGSDGVPHFGDEFVASGSGKALKKRVMGEGEHTAEYLFIGKSKGDYHDSMNAKNFSEWVEQRLVPTFVAKYGEEMRMILVLDNAPCVFASRRCFGASRSDPIPREPQVPPQHRAAGADQDEQDSARRPHEGQR